MLCSFVSKDTNGQFERFLTDLTIITWETDHGKKHDVMDESEESLVLVSQTRTEPLRFISLQTSKN